MWIPGGPLLNIPVAAIFHHYPPVDNFVSKKASNLGPHPNL
jgi:hypothetical protein